MNLSVLSFYVDKLRDAIVESQKVRDAGVNQAAFEATAKKSYREHFCIGEFMSGISVIHWNFTRIPNSNIVVYLMSFGLFL